MEPIIPAITKADALAMLAEAIEAKGSEYVYSNLNDHCAPLGCVYVHGTEKAFMGHDEYGDPLYEEVTTDSMEPGCMIGTALVGRGIPMSKFVDLEVNADTPVYDLLRIFVAQGLIGPVSVGAEDVLRAAQTAQDKGSSWGAAYIEAKREVDMYEKD